MTLNEARIRIALFVGGVAGIAFAIATMVQVPVYLGFWLAVNFLFGSAVLTGASAAVIIWSLVDWVLETPAASAKGEEGRE